ncbi:MAG: hypothetical protein OXK82_10640 [Deltaproteobacteria bacterium]|nr:hypothetical protein [Deltaproteobacteria bacterium]
MTAEELAGILQKMRVDAPKDESSAMAVLFGIRYAEELRQCIADQARNGVSQTATLKQIDRSYGPTDVWKGMRVARYVIVRPM